MRILGMLTLAVSFLVASSAVAQLKDDLFKTPAKPGEFNDKVMGLDPTLSPVPPPAPAVGSAPVKPPPPLWCGSTDFGLSGSTGNTEVLKIRLGANAKRQTEDNLFTTDILFGLVQNGDVTTEKKALFNARDEFLFRDSPWALFVSAQMEYDEFRAFDYRIASHTGFAYQFLKTETTNLRTRLGAGISREIGGPNDRWVPEGLAGFDLYQKITDRQKMLLIFDYYPDLADVSRYRIRLRTAYEILLEPEWGLAVRFGIQDRFDSKPGPARRNDLDYFTTLVLKF